MVELNHFVDDLIRYIFQFIEAHDLCTAERVCKRWRIIALDDGK
jgi:hypothetical protein